MWSRRRFLEAASGLPVVGGLVGAVALKTEPVAAMGAPDYFRDLGVRPFINASGTYTAMTASLMPPEVMDAIAYASKHYVMLEELQQKVGERIASLVHAEGAMVTSGAASALTLGTAAVLTGTDQRKMVSLPDLTGMKSEVIIQKAHRFGYDHAVRNCGVRMVEVETREDLERAVNDKTAMMIFYNNNNKEGRIQDEEFVQLGKKHSIPTMNDAAADVPPVDNLWKYTKMGFDLVAFSGGKGIRGPQSAGLLLGTKDSDRRRPPQRSAERQHHRPRHEGEQGRDRRHAGGARAVPEEGSRARTAGVRATRRGHPRKRGVGRRCESRESSYRRSPTTCRTCASRGTAATPRRRRPSLPRCATASRRLPSARKNRRLVVGVWMMRPGEEKIVARRLKEVLTKRTLP